MKKFFCFALIIIMLLPFAACAKVQTVQTALGDFELSKQEVQASIKDNLGGSYSASAGNILLIVLLKPADGTNVTMDQAQSFFTNGSQAVVDGKTYELKCMDFEKSSGAILYGLVFEIADSGYDNSHQPSVSLNLPSALPTPEPTATPAPSASASASPSNTASASPSPSTSSKASATPSSKASATPKATQKASPTPKKS